MKHIPNILTILRLLLTPLFIIMFFTVHPLAALPVSWLAGVTDILDGYLARRNGWVSKLGKVLDPTADKLMQGALLVCIVVEGLLPWPFVIPLVLKELAQGVCGFIMFRCHRVLVVSRWYGKVALTLFHLVVNLTVILAALLDPVPLAVKIMLGCLWLCTLGVMMFAFVSYVVAYARMAAAIKKEWGEGPESGQLKSDGNVF